MGLMTFSSIMLEHCEKLFCHDFHSGEAKLQSINGSYITPVPKKVNHETVTISNLYP
jgi:hypothetical protein